MIRLGLIGCGEHSEIGHAVPLARYRSAHPDAIELAVACDVQVERAQKFCAKYGFLRAYGNVDELLRKEKLDGCIMVVPPDRISALAIRVLKTGIACVVEKPLGASLTEVKTLREAAAGTSNMVSVNRRFMPFLNRALGWTRSAGKIKHSRCTMTRHNRAEAEFIWATAVHAVDTLRYVSGDVSSFSIRRLNGAHDVAWYSIELVFQNQSTGRIDVLPTAGMVEETYDFFGDGFRATVTSPFGPQRGWRASREGKLEVEEIAPPDMPEDISNGFYDEASEFIRALQTGGNPRPTIADVAPSVELCMTLAETLNSTK